MTIPIFGWRYLAKQSYSGEILSSGGGKSEDHRITVLLDAEPCILIEVSTGLYGATTQKTAIFSPTKCVKQFVVSL
jgi:hypothetical protein